VITKDEALSLRSGQVLFHRKLRNRDGTALRGKVTGKVQSWKTRPDDFKVPMKHGLKDHFYLTPSNASDWCTEPRGINE
jgi:hypothetical protein